MCHFNTAWWQAQLLGERVFVVFVPPNTFVGYAVSGNTTLERITFGGFQPCLHFWITWEALKNMSMLSRTAEILI